MIPEGGGCGEPRSCHCTCLGNNSETLSRKKKIIGNSKVLLFVLYFLVFTVLLLRDIMCLGLLDNALFFRVVYVAGNLETKKCLSSDKGQANLLLAIKPRDSSCLVVLSCGANQLCAQHSTRPYISTPQPRGS